MEVERSEIEIRYAYDAWVVMIQKRINEYYAKNYTHTPAPTVFVRPGRKYWKLVTVDSNQTFVHSFVRKTDGAIFKPASFRAPNVKGASAIRGHVCDGSNGMNATTASGGIRYAS
tara:strand:- start:311 stop:655 length:345 start_codon:yes stop_codon:yes gene_type:complete